MEQYEIRKVDIDRYDVTKRGSFQVSLTFYDWELSILIGLIREKRKALSLSKNYATYLDNLDKKLSRALGMVLKTEFKDLKFKDEDLNVFFSSA